MILLLLTPAASTTVTCLFDPELFDPGLFDSCSSPAMTTRGHPGWKPRRVIEESSDQNDLALVLLVS